MPGTTITALATATPSPDGSSRSRACREKDESQKKHNEPARVQISFLPLGYHLQWTSSGIGSVSKAVRIAARSGTPSRVGRPPAEIFSSRRRVHEQIARQLKCAHPYGSWSPPIYRDPRRQRAGPVPVGQIRNPLPAPKLRERMGFGRWDAPGTPTNSHGPASLGERGAQIRYVAGPRYHTHSLRASRVG